MSSPNTRLRGHLHVLVQGETLIEGDRYVRCVKSQSRTGALRFWRAEIDLKGSQILKPVIYDRARCPSACRNRAGCFRSSNINAFGSATVTRPGACAKTKYLSALSALVVFGDAAIHRRAACAGDYWPVLVAIPMFVIPALRARSITSISCCSCVPLSPATITSVSFVAFTPCR